MENGFYFKINVENVMNFYWQTVDVSNVVQILFNKLIHWVYSIHLILFERFISFHSARQSLVPAGQIQIFDPHELRSSRWFSRTWGMPINILHNAYIHLRWEFDKTEWSEGPFTMKFIKAVQAFVVYSSRNSCDINNFHWINSLIEFFDELIIRNDKNDK